MYRYATKSAEDEKDSNVYLKEMIEMMKNEKVKTNLYVKAVKLSEHAFRRVRRHLGIFNLATANKTVKEMLQKAVRIGTILSKEGRINVMYVYNQIAFFLSPDLKTVVTVNKFTQTTWRFGKEFKGEDVSKEELIERHWAVLREMEAEEDQMIQFILAIEAKVSDAKSQFSSHLGYLKKNKHRYEITKTISEQNMQLKNEARKLFRLKSEKRRLCKSLASLY